MDSEIIKALKENLAEYKHLLAAEQVKLNGARADAIVLSPKGVWVTKGDGAFASDSIYRLDADYPEEPKTVKAEDIDDICVIIRQPIEVFGVDRYHQIEQTLDIILAPLGFSRETTDKTDTQIYIHYRCFGMALKD